MTYQNCAAYSVFLSGMTPHGKIAHFNWECIGCFKTGVSLLSLHNRYCFWLLNMFTLSPVTLLIRSTEGWSAKCFQTRSLDPSLGHNTSWCNWRTFWTKNVAGRSPWGSCSYTTMPRFTGNLKPRRKWPFFASNALITHPILRIWPRRTTTSSWTAKTTESSPFFVRRGGHCCRGDLVGRTTFWIIFEWLTKVRATD